ncbi:caspase domain-containing protein [Xylaria intraflava]|nr:caspase domain-containing protein [Xylaria intraflava]
MPSHDPRPKRWAVIIGIDYYPSDRCLQGSVRDAQMVRELLEKGDLPVDIKTFTATTPLSGSCPTEEKDKWPTYDNVISALINIIKNAQPGDFVYIHYSGHGTQLPSHKESGSSVGGELALCLFDKDYKDKNLRGHHLAMALGKMVDKGLIVTLVLDCCFSGSVARDDDWDGFDVRCIDYDPDASIEPETEEDGIFGLNDISRDAQVDEDWLVDPKGYTILSACGPYERAYEVNIEGHGRRGALTYFLVSTLRALEANGENITQQSLHEHLRTKFHASWPQQTPMRYGNQQLSFFGSLVSTPETASVSVYRAEDGRICLRAGQIHGVSEGDEFALLPFSESGQATEQREQPTRILKVQTVRPFESDLVHDGLPSETTAEITTGWKARSLTSSSPRKIRVQLAADIDDKFRWKDASQELRYLHLVTEAESQACMFNVAINVNGEYAVLDTLRQQVTGLPTVPVTAPDAMTKVLGILEHLTTFKYFEKVENLLPNKSFQALFSLTANSAVDPSGVYAVAHRDIWGFTIENISEKPLYMAIYNFRSFWEVTNLVSNTGGDSYLVVPPREDGINGTKTVKLRMEVPEGSRTGATAQCEDILKVFITSKPVSFPTLILPEMSRDIDRLGEQDRGSDDLVFPTALRLHFRGTDDNEIGDEWATQNFIIQTTFK